MINAFLIFITLLLTCGFRFGSNAAVLLSSEGEAVESYMTFDDQLEQMFRGLIK
jgi:hypothetical protein